MTPKCSNNTIWQWNCRGFINKRAVLQAFLDGSDHPEVIAVQECGKNSKLAGYKSYPGIGNDTQVVTFVKRNVTAMQHETGNTEIDHSLVELIPRKRAQRNLYVLNIYSSPKQRKCDFGDLFLKVKSLAQGDPLLVVGDFNAPHPAWGYKHTLAKGRALWEKVQHHNLVLITDPMHPTRQGNSVSADTTPDLTLTHGGIEATWCNTGEDLGSDHKIIEIVVSNGPPVPKKRKHRVTNWDAFRNIGTDNEPIEDIGTWSRKIIDATQTATDELEVDEVLEIVDSHLIGLWRKKRDIEEKIRNKRWDRNLRKRIAILNKQIEEYSLQLTKQNWGNICDQMNRELSSAKTWKLLRHLLDPDKTRSEAQQQLQRLVYKFDGSSKELLDEVRNRYLSPPTRETLPDYTGSANEALDAPLTVAEVRAEINRLRTKTAAGPDRVSNKMLRNLNDESICNLTNYMQRCWDRGEIPPQWKEANLALIPKPGKKLGLENLRPISITSCVGKLMEHVIQNRLSRYLEDKELYPDTMIGFRAKLSVCDVMLQIKEEIIEKVTQDTRVIVGLDVAKAFDNVKHTAILNNLSSLNVGVKTYNYVRDFLSNRTATIKLGGASLENIQLGNRGTPQGSVLSPTLFNIAMIGLPERLNKIEDLHYTIYADDLTLWVNHGSDGHIEEVLQKAICEVEKYLEPIGLKCSAEKSEALFIVPNNFRKASRNDYDIMLRAGGRPIPAVERIRVLGLYVQANGKNTETIRKLENSIEQICRMLKRISNKHGGMKEANLLRLFQTFGVSRILFVAPFLKLTKAEKSKLDIIIRKGIKSALGLPPNTSTAKILSLGVSNTIDELIEATKASQQQRLLGSRTGRKILERLGYKSREIAKDMKDLPKNVREKLTISPLPRNMNPAYHEGRRRSRAITLQIRYGGRPDVLYTDAAEHIGKKAYTAVAVTEDGVPHSCCTILSCDTQDAEEAAIALALTEPGTRVIVSDSKSAIRNYDRGRISNAAWKILANAEVTAEQVTLIWAPAHRGLIGNEKAHAAARGLTFRTIAEDALDPFVQASPRVEELGNFHEITQHYRLARKVLPPANPQLSRKEEVYWRKLQTGVFANPLLYSKWHPKVYDSRCKNCNGVADLVHMAWTCPSYNKPHRNTASWEVLLLSLTSSTQRKVIGLALEAAVSQGIPAD